MTVTSFAGNFLWLSVDAMMLGNSVVAVDDDVQWFHVHLKAD